MLLGSTNLGQYRLAIQLYKIYNATEDVISLVETWLTERFFYVEIDNVTSPLMVTWFGIIQGSILGPILYAIFISPLFDIEKVTFYADDGFGLVRNRDRKILVSLMEINEEGRKHRSNYQLQVAPSNNIVVIYKICEKLKYRS